MQEKKRVVISLIITFLLVLAVFTIGQAVGLRFGLFDKEGFRKVLLESGYYRETNLKLEEMTSNVMESYHLPSQLGKDLWKQAEIHNDMDDYTRSIMEGYPNAFVNELTTMNFVEKIKERLRRNMDAYYREANLEVDEGEWRRTQKEIEQIVSYNYEQVLEMPLIYEYIGFCNRMNRHIALVTAISGGVVLLLVGVLFLLRARKRDGFRYAAYATFSASLLIMASGYVMSLGFLLNKDFLPDALYREVGDDLVRMGWNYTSLMGVIGVLVGCSLFLLHVVIKKKEKSALL